MIQNVLIAVLFWAIFGLWAWNFWGAIFHDKFYLRSTEYSRAKSKAWFWIAVITSVPMLVMVGGMAILETAVLLGYEP